MFAKWIYECEPMGVPIENMGINLALPKGISEQADETYLKVLTN